MLKCQVPSKALWAKSRVDEKKKLATNSFKRIDYLLRFMWITLSPLGLPCQSPFFECSSLSNRDCSIVIGTRETHLLGSCCTLVQATGILTRESNLVRIT